ncbi:hypothetical protein DCS_06656 [Drechmeria coniospora]|uniref:N-alpha-acetyltransferase 40 n=1 Tax=Drechmeria coniospora TaxID=98403 RepID=A0A151GC49_DRECN|nr:hypothetical protein DCS_06656 [Drechmeria coniospora]KYK54696.1 hypothetical protein DCS_06656 [Drechmeria coniospora]ODA76082.1 hypothetical protein RJ55_08365 [Drechmeria coniospora]
MTASSNQTGRVRGRRKPRNEIEEANKKSNGEFLTEYIQPSQGWPEWIHPRTGARYTLSLTQAPGLGDDQLESCFRLIAETSGEDYRNSSLGWHPAAKRREMRSPDLRYILVSDSEGRVQGFTSMMPTFENGEAVVYCYEIHIAANLRAWKRHSTGLGSQLISYLGAAAERIPSVCKVMLTCFAGNAHALAFYARLGFEVDDFSPRERILRGGKVFVPDYVILSRKTVGAHRRGSSRIDGLLENAALAET